METTTITSFRRGFEHFLKLAEKTCHQWNCLQQTNVDFSKIDGCVKTTKSLLDDMQRIIQEMDHLRKTICNKEEFKEEEEEPSKCS